MSMLAIIGEQRGKRGWMADRHRPSMRYTCGSGSRSVKTCKENCKDLSWLLVLRALFGEHHALIVQQLLHIAVNTHALGGGVWGVRPPQNPKYPSQTRCLGKTLTKNVFLRPFWEIFRPALGIFRKGAGPIPRFLELPRLAVKLIAVCLAWYGAVVTHVKLVVSRI